MNEGKFKERINSLRSIYSDVFMKATGLPETKEETENTCLAEMSTFIPKARVERILDEAKKDLENRLEKARFDAHRRHPGGCIIIDNILLNIYVDWVKAWFGDAK